MIYGKVGRIGHGKTMRAVVDAIELADRRGVVLASNITVNRPGEGETVTLPMDGFSDALGVLIDECYAEKRGLVVLVDEVDTIWDAREWADMSKLDRFRIKQSRKLGVDVIWTAQFVDQVEKSLRNITEEVGLMRAYPNPTISRREAGKRPWFLIESRFRPGAVRELTASPDSDKRLGRAVHLYRRRHELLYDTDELVRPSADAPPVRRGRRSTLQPVLTGSRSEGLTAATVADARLPAGGRVPAGVTPAANQPVEGVPSAFT